MSIDGGTGAGNAPEPAALFQQVASVTDSLSHTTTFAYDPLGRLTSVTDSLSQQTTLYS